MSMAMHQLHIARASGGSPAKGPGAEASGPWGGAPAAGAEASGPWGGAPAAGAGEATPAAGEATPAAGEAAPAAGEAAPAAGEEPSAGEAPPREDPSWAAAGTRVRAQSPAVGVACCCSCCSRGAVSLLRLNPGGIPRRMAARPRVWPPAWRQRIRIVGGAQKRCARAEKKKQKSAKMLRSLHLKCAALRHIPTHLALYTFSALCGAAALFPY